MEPIVSTEKPKTSISLAMYEFRVKRNDNSQEYFKFDKIPHLTESDKQHDLLKMLKTVFDDLKDENECLYDKSQKIDNGKRIYVMESKIEGRTIYGQIALGYWGNERSVRNIPTNKEKDAVKEDDGVFDPYYFLLVMPKNEERGCLILERKKGIGIRDVFKNVILGSLVNYTDYAQYKIILYRAYPKELKERYYEKGQLSSLNYTITRPPEDYVDNMEYTVGKIEIKLKIDGNTPISPEEFFKNNQDNLLRFNGREYEEVKVVSKYKGKPKSFTLTDPETLIPYLDITDEIKKTIKGNPELECIDKIARKHAKINFEKIWDALEDS